VKLGKCAHENCAMLSEAYGTDTMEKSSVFERHKLLKDGWLNVEYIEGSGRKKTHKKMR
jgi:hypothetical protein